MFVHALTMSRATGLKIRLLLTLASMSCTYANHFACGLQVYTGKLTMVDLAGSERASETNNVGRQLKDGANINRYACKDKPAHSWFLYNTELPQNQVYSELQPQTLLTNSTLLCVV